jgi:hypothetical protein
MKSARPLMSVRHYPIQAVTIQTISMPAGATILKLAVTDKGPQLFALVDTLALWEEREIRLYDMDEDIPDPENLKYIGSIGSLVGERIFHCFEAVGIIV